MSKRRDERVSNSASFRTSMDLRSRRGQLVDTRPSRGGIGSKKTGQKFVQSLGGKIPGGEKRFFGHKDLPLETGTVIKPFRGSNAKGVYLLVRNNEIWDVYEKKTLHSKDELQRRISQDICSGRIKADRFIVEELICEDKEKTLPGRDLKFYCFYGKVPLIREIIRFPEAKHCWWDAQGNNLRTGVYENRLFKGEGFSREDIQLTEHISSEIPVPFIRLDFIKSCSGLVYCEAHTVIGEYGFFNKKMDHWLGEMYLEAEGRLLVDLFRKKPFDAYSSFFLTKEGSCSSVAGRRNVQLKVKGKVQRVGYRKWTKKKALELELNGFVKNLEDKSVKVVLEGPSDVVEKMKEECWKGPEKAHVTSIEEIDRAREVKPGFRILK